MKLSSFILVLCCILSLVFAKDTLKCDCKNTVPNCDQLPRCGKAILRNQTSCEIYKTVNKTKIAECNEIHFSENLNNTLKCPDGTKAWPLMFIWNVTYEDVKITLIDNSTSTRPVYKINNKFPTPTIHAIKGDWVLIPVINNITKLVNGEKKCGELTTIHWHGITMKLVERMNHTIVPGTPFMDGVPGINQCPIPGCDKKNNRFDYFFQFMDSGTYWYHSHYETQLADGLAGPMIVKDCDDIDRVKDINNCGPTYCETDDWDATTIAVRDWFSNTTAEKEFEEYKYVKKGEIISTVTNGTTTGKTVLDIPIEPFPETVLINGGTNFTLSVTKGKAYRLRLINMSAMALFNFSIEKHTFEIIEVEGMLVKRNERNKPEPFTFLTINTGQRYSILVNANQDVGVYGIYFYATGCRRDDPPTIQNITGTIRYDNASGVANQKKVFPKIKPTDCVDLPMNALFPYCDDKNFTPPARNGNTYKMNIAIDTLSKNISKINDTDPWEQNVAGYLSHDIDAYWDHKWSNIKNNTFLEVLKFNITNNTKYWDPTLNVINLKEPNKVHDIIFINADPLEHPIHLHGHFFYVLGFGYNFTADYSLNEINPIQRDTITVPRGPGGWAQIRFVVDNPGVWPMHCHIDWHLGVGMLAQFVELGRSDVAKIYTEDNNKPPKEWCDACTDVKNVESYCANKIN